MANNLARRTALGGSLDDLSEIRQYSQLEACRKIVQKKAQEHAALREENESSHKESEEDIELERLLEQGLAESPLKVTKRRKTAAAKPAPPKQQPQRRSTRNKRENNTKQQIQTAIGGEPDEASDNNDDEQRASSPNNERIPKQKTKKKKKRSRPMAWGGDLDRVEHIGRINKDQYTDAIYEAL